MRHVAFRASPANSRFRCALENDRRREVEGVALTPPARAIRLGHHLKKESGRTRSPRLLPLPAAYASPPACIYLCTCCMLQRKSPCSSLALACTLIPAYKDS